VTATGIDTGVATKSITNEAGAYQFASLQPGKYRVTAEMTGFQNVTYNPVELNVSANVRLNFKLPVAGTATTVEVSAAAESPLLTATSVVGNVIRGQQILDLPLIDRSAVNLATTQANFSGGLGEGVNVAGGSTQSLMTTLNGINVSNTRLNRAGGLESFQFSQTVDMVEEVRSSPARPMWRRADARWGKCRWSYVPGLMNSTAALWMGSATRPSTPTRSSTTKTVCRGRI